MIALPTIFLATKTKRVFTILSPDNPDEQCICLFASMRAATRFKKRMQLIAKKYHPVDLKVQGIIQSFKHLENGSIRGFAVISTGEADEDVLFHKIERPEDLRDDAEPIADAPHRHAGIKPSKRRRSK